MAASQAARNARLQLLLSATQAWATAQTAVINGQVTVLQNILTGRTGSASLPQAAVNATSTLTVSSISAFLTGD
jgi:hypothetical protein